jgi:hypothetical protein
MIKYREVVYREDSEVCLLQIAAEGICWQESLTQNPSARKLSSKKDFPSMLQRDEIVISLPIDFKSNGA